MNYFDLLFDRLVSFVDALARDSQDFLGHNHSRVKNRHKTAFLLFYGGACILIHSALQLFSLWPTHTLGLRCLCVLCICNKCCGILCPLRVYIVLQGCVVLIEQFNGFSFRSSQGVLGVFLLLLIVVRSVEVNFLSYRYRVDKSTIFGTRGLWGLTVNSGRGVMLKYS